jgi:DNA polymerase III delta prime subunit
MLEVNLLRIDQELAHNQQVVQDTGELTAELDREEGAAKHALEVVQAEAARGMRRADDKISEARVKSELPLDEEVQRAQSTYLGAMYDAQLAKSLHRAMVDKSRSIAKACDMIVSGFISPSSYSPERRKRLTGR